VKEAERKRGERYEERKGGSTWTWSGCEGLAAEVRRAVRTSLAHCPVSVSTPPGLYLP